MGFWAPPRAYWASPGAETEWPVREALTVDAIGGECLHGVAGPSLAAEDVTAARGRGMGAGR